MPLATALHPHGTLAEVHRHQRLRGQWARTNRDGRPFRKKERKDRLLDQVLTSHRDGHSYRAIAEAMNLPFGNVRNWTKKRDKRIAILLTNAAPAEADEIGAAKHGAR